jgi:hypothetical protein
MTLIYLIHEVWGIIYEQIELPEWKIQCFKERHASYGHSDISDLLGTL